MKKINIIIGVFLFIVLLIFYKEIGNFFFQKESIGRVLKVDNENAMIQGLSKVGSQSLEIEVLTGKYRGKILEINNLLNDSMEYDEYYEVKDKVLIYVFENDGKLVEKVLSILRIDKLIVLSLVFIILLLTYARSIGVKSLISFLGNVLIIWNFLITSLRNRENVFLITILTLIFLSGLIIFLVAGFTKKGVSAFLGTMSDYLSQQLLLLYLEILLK